MYFAFRVSHFEISELFADGYVFQNFQVADHFVDIRLCLKGRVGFRQYFVLLLFTQVVTVFV